MLLKYSNKNSEHFQGLTSKLKTGQKVSLTAVLILGLLELSPDEQNSAINLTELKCYDRILPC